MAEGEKIALRLLSRRWHTKRKLGEKLAARGISQDEIDSVLQQMEEFGYLNDERYAEIWLRDKLAQGRWGPKRLCQELMRQGIEAELAQSLVAEAFPPGSDREWELALKVGRKKARQLGPDPALSKVAAAMARWGFSPEIIWRVLRTLEDDSLDS